jgi:magnesium chelatase subunit I
MNDLALRMDHDASGRDAAPDRASAPPPPTRPVYPFAALVGQDEMRLALMIAVIDPGIGGVLVLGDRGTGKSTAIRALARLLPPMRAVSACRYRCDPASDAAWCDECRARAAHGPLPAERCAVPVVDLPLGATEDRVVGALDLERALSQGVRHFEPGLLARANRGFLYVDEVNLLEDHIVDLLLDVAASGENLVEREGLSVRHPARFVLVGSGNPEEGELRPQLLDRFGLSVEVRTPTDLPTRVEVVRRRDAFERDPAGFVAAWETAEAELRARLVRARAQLPSVGVPDAMMERMARLCIALGVDGLRGELTLLRAARSAASLAGASRVADSHLHEIAALALRHRLRRNPLDDTGSTARVERALSELPAA